jgi:hypothetical protein
VKTVRAPRTAICGSWAKATSPTGKGLTRAHGPIKNCVGFERTWYVFQQGATGVDGGVEEFHCPTVGCAPSRVTFQASRWTYVAPPFQGGLTLLDVEVAASWSVDDAGHELIFHPATGTFTSESP